jgi:hypothetical protein
MATVRHDDSQFGRWHQSAPESLKGRWYMFLLLWNEADSLANGVVQRWTRSRLCAECLGHLLVCVSELEGVVGGVGGGGTRWEQ